MRSPAQSAGRDSYGKSDQRWDYRCTKRGCRSLESDHAVRDLPDVRSAVVRTISGYIGAVDNQRVPGTPGEPFTPAKGYSTFGDPYELRNEGS